MAILAAGLLAVTPPAALALELGEAMLRSALGQPLVVEIPYRLAANERLDAACIGLVGPRPTDALPAYSRVSRIAVTPTHIEIVGATRVLDPLLGLTLDVHCPGGPRFVRGYELFVDPPSRVPATASDGVRFATAAPQAPSSPASNATSEPRSAIPVSGSAGVSAVAAAAGTPRASSTARARGQGGGPVRHGETYLVVSGDTLSGIAARIVDRSVTIREAADAIFAANPDAFARGNRDLLKAGSSITIPLLAAGVAPPAAVQRQGASNAEPAATMPLPPAPPREAASGTVPLAPATAPAVLEPPASAPIEPAPFAIEPAPAAVAPAAPAASVANDSPASAPAVSEPEALASAAAAGPASVGGASTWWWTSLLALGAVAALSALLFLRRRKPAAPAPKSLAVRRAAPPRRLVDPLAGFDVVEGQLPPALAAVRVNAAPSEPVAAPAVAQGEATRTSGLALGAGLTAPVDLDVGSPVTFDEPVDWFEDRDRTATTTVVNAPTDEPTATVRMAEPDAPADADRPGAPERGTACTDERTLTLVELEMVRQDHVTGQTLTHATNKALRDAEADLEAAQTQALRVANGDTATIEMPEADSIETQPTQRLRKAR